MRTHRLSDRPERGEQDAYTRLVERGAKHVAVVTARAGGWDHAAVVSDHLSISYDPPTLLVSLYALSRIAEAATESGRFALQLLTSDQRRLAQTLSDPGAPLPGLLDRIPHERLDEDGPALLHDVAAWFDARVVSVHEEATHLLLVGRVLAMGSDAEPGVRPLLRYRSGYFAP